MVRRPLSLRIALALLLLSGPLYGSTAARADDSTPASSPASTPAPSPAAEEMLKSMREKGILSEKEYDNLYRRQARYEAEQRARESLPGWLRDWTFGGDMRLRWERQQFHDGLANPERALTIGVDNVDANNLTVQNLRDRYRIRLRLGAEKRLGEGVTFGFRISTSMGTSFGSDTCGLSPGVCGDFSTPLAGDPRSANSTLGGFFSPKNIFLDRAYLVWQPTFAPAFQVMAGKFKNPFLSPDDPADMIIWDHDIQPEGAAARYRFDFVPEKLWLDTTAGYFVLNEVASATIPNLPYITGNSVQPFRPSYSERDPYMYGIQGGLTAQPTEWWKVGARASFYDLQNLGTSFVAALNGLGNTGDSVDHNPLLVLLTPASPYFQDGSSKGRMKEEVASGFFTFAPFGPRLGITPFYQWSSITNASAQNQAWAAGIDFGTPDLLKLTVMYADVKRDGTIALFTDSDLFGGLTNAKGWYAKLERQLTSSLSFEATFSESRISQEKCAVSATSNFLCDTGLFADQGLADAFNKTRRHRMMILLDLIARF